MIIAERKPLEEIVQMIGEAKKVLLVGCGTCVSVCMAGGEKEVAITASQLRMLFKREGKNVTF
jgi:ferredoxin